MRVTIDRSKPLDIILYELERDDGRKITIQLQNGELTVMRTNSKKRPKLNEEDKLALFRVILADNRRTSFGDNGYKAAAIGTTEEGRMFVSINTKRQHQYYKDCAEQNALTVATQAISTRAMKTAGETAENPPKLTELFMMGGREKTAERPAILMSCPCGKRVDMLATAMSSPDSKIYVMPIPQEPLPDIVENPFPYEVKTEENAKTLRTGIDAEKNIWKVSMGYLNANREIEISPLAAESYVTGVKTLLGRLSTAPTPVLDGAAIKLAAKVARKEIHAQIEHIEDTVGPDGKPTTPVNDFIRGRIDAMVESRWRAHITRHPEADKDAFLKELGVVRCAVLQQKDGTISFGLEVEGEMDNAMPNSEVNSLTNAVETLCEHGVKNVWVMEFNPGDVKRLEQKFDATPRMHTSPKEGIERIYKRGTEGLKFHFIPYNNGLEEKELQSVTRSFLPPQIFPSDFGGIKGTNGHHSHASGHACGGL